MTCQESRKQLSVLQDNELEADFRTALCQHLEKCAACRAEWGGLEELLTVLQRLPENEPSPALAAAVMSRIVPRPAGKRRWLPSLAYTLTFLLVFVGGFLLTLPHRQEQVAVQNEMTATQILLNGCRLGLLNVQDATLAIFQESAHGQK